MKKDEIQLGMKVVATHLPTATVYTVNSIRRGNDIELTYQLKNGDIINAGSIDVCFLTRPTAEQLSNA